MCSYSVFYEYKIYMLVESYYVVWYIIPKRIYVYISYRAYYPLMRMRE